MAQCRRTILSTEAAHSILAAALGPEYATMNSVALLMAHSALETGRWKAMYNWNFGNIGGNGDDGNFRLEDCGIETPPGNPPTFAAYSSPETGAFAMVSLIRKRYPEAWRDLLEGNARSYVANLKNRGYFTAALGPYQDAVEKLYIGYGGIARPKVDSEPPSGSAA